jgi:hypothetical protein
MTRRRPGTRPPNRIAPAGKRPDSSVRQAVEDGSQRCQFERMRETYRRMPDSEAEADDWSTYEAAEAHAGQ